MTLASNVASVAVQEALPLGLFGIYKYTTDISLHYRSLETLEDSKASRHCNETKQPTVLATTLYS